MKRGREEISVIVYEACRLEAKWSGRRVVPEKWEKRDKKFREQFEEVITRYMLLKKLSTPKQAHNSWMKSYIKMGWKYGKKRDTVKKTHPDILPFEKLPKDEKDKDAIFLAVVWATKELTQPKTKEAR